MSAPRRLQAGPASVNDRLTITLFLAGFFHLIVILGISFAPPDPDRRPVPTLAVLLAGDSLPASQRNDEAAYLAERTQAGSGNSQDGETRRPGLGNAPIDAPGAESGTAGPGAEDRLPGDSRVLTGHDAATRAQSDSPDDALTLPQRAQMLLAGEGSPFAGTGRDADLSLRGPARRELLVSPSTRASEVAVYLDAWRQRVEQLGTLHFPNEARRRDLSGNPVIEVVLASGGGLVRASVRRTSGFPELDQAAIEILKLAAPFDAFPEPLAARYDVLRFAYEWQFVGGRLTGSSVEVPVDELRPE